MGEDDIRNQLKECEKKLEETNRLRLVEESVMAGLREEGFSEKALEFFRYRKNFLVVSPEEYNADVVGSFTGSCGDKIDTYLKIEGGIIKDAKYTTDGCPGAVTSGSAMTSLIVGKNVEDIEDISVTSIAEYLREGHKGLPEHMYGCCGIAVGSCRDAINRYKGAKR